MVNFIGKHQISRWRPIIQPFSKFANNDREFGYKYPLVGGICFFIRYTFFGYRFDEITIDFYTVVWRLCQLEPSRKHIHATN